MNSLLRDIGMQFAHEVSQYDIGKYKRSRAEMRESLLVYWEQEMSSYLYDFIRSEEGEKILDAVYRRYTKPYKETGVRYGTSGYHK